MNFDEFVTEKIKEQFPDAIEDVVDFRGDRTLIITMESLHPICLFLRDSEDLQYNFLTDVVADDLLPEYPRFAVSYHIRSMANKNELRLRTFVEDPEEGPKTLADIWKIATWLEMEVYDLMGINFEGNKNQRRLFLPEDWVGHPLRKDYPLGYEEVQFSFNWEAIQDRKPYAGRKKISKN